MNVIMHLCLSICLQLHGKNLYLCETPMCFRYIYYFVIILLWEVSQEEQNILFNFG